MDDQVSRSWNNSAHLFLLLSWFASLQAYGQMQNSQWLYYDHWIDHRSGTPVLIEDEPTGSARAALCDSTGELLVYWSVGFQGGLYGPDHQLASDQPLLAENFNCHQGAFFIPRPGVPGQAFVVTPNRAFSSSGPWRFGIIQLDLGISTGQPAFLEPDFTWFMFDAIQKGTVIPHENGTDHWFVSQLAASDQFHAFQVTTDGITQPPVVSQAGTVVPEEWVQGKLSASTSGDMILSISEVLIDDPSMASLCELFSFDRSTGEVGFVCGFNDHDRVMGAEFSPNDRYLYIADRSFHPPLYHRRLYQFDLTADDIPMSKALVDSTAWATMGSGIPVVALALAPDGKIYMAQDGPGLHLSVVPQPDLGAPACGYDGEALAFSSPIRGLPSSIKRYQDQASGTSILDVPRANAPVVAPNPLRSSGLLMCPGWSGVLLIQWMDAQGRLLRTARSAVVDGHVALDVEGLASGQYMLLVRSQDATAWMLRVSVII